ncbi:MAG: hypothetical protein H0V08_07015 [Thermoleophilaceae bacterium]|nr:hypothetical protein [Thermoleophilaceae bacterium]
MTVIAHVGHDLVSLIFFVPVVAFLAWLAIDQVRARRGERDAGRGGADARPDA